MSLAARLDAAVAAGDTATLIAVYAEAADQAPDIDTACFLLTQAYVYALEAGDPRAAALRARLSAEGREPA